MLDNYTSIDKAEQSACSSDFKNQPIDLPVFVASDRKALNDSVAQGVLAPLQFGCATVTVPDQDTWHSASQSALRTDLQQLGWKKNESSEALAPPKINIRGYTISKNSLDTVSSISTDNFWPTLKSKVESSNDHNVYVYIHGFGESAQNSIYASGILASQLEAPVIDFSWPSSGNIGSVFMPFGKHSTAHLYRSDRKTIDNPQVCSDLSNLLSELHQQLGPDSKINLIAHSLGNRLLAHYLEEDRQQKFHSVYFLAADLSKREFLQAAPQITQQAEHAAVFMNPHDKVLAASGLNSLLEFHSAKKLGKASIYAEGIQFIDYGAIAQPRHIGHYIPFNILAGLIRTGILSQGENSSTHLYINKTTNTQTMTARTEARI